MIGSGLVESCHIVMGRNVTDEMFVVNSVYFSRADGNHQKM